MSLSTAALGATRPLPRLASPGAATLPRLNVAFPTFAAMVTPEGARGTALTLSRRTGVRDAATVASAKPSVASVSPPAHTLRRFIAVANEALAKWQVAQLDKVVEFPGQH
jgi:hypothetical protein